MRRIAASFNRLPSVGEIMDLHAIWCAVSGAIALPAEEINGQNLLLVGGAARDLTGPVGRIGQHRTA
ncbi:hypothetical protein NDU88_008184 [Pleurodeles waltl]|uniref:Uncharacterized protein n=1 Tax=Pleurodeles waltl TaxID=8319 RepID=A0AAV7NVR8_PLEWA|nr:hypothetical protein NDU88_008184 [Pleurodeles waltl]